MGMDSREVTPQLVRASIHLAAELRSFERAEIALKKVVGQKISCSTIRRLAMQVGHELADLESVESDDTQEVVVPEVAVVLCDGGRIRTREAGRGRGVVPSGENGWRESKNAALERMRLPAQHDGCSDPCPDLPTSFRTAAKVANLAEKPVPSVDSPAAGQRPPRVIYEGPKRVLRTVLSSMKCSDDFGPLMQREARRRRFYESPLRAFIGDGLPWNWSIWKRHFREFVPILDFIHAIEYVFAAAMQLHCDEEEGWQTYLQWITLCWQGRVDQVISDLQAACQERGIDLIRGLADDDPNRPLTDAVRYLTNNRTRMNYPRYRELGLPVTSAPMESVIKQMNLRVKGTEMFWNDSDGAEAILHLRAATLSDDDRLDHYLTTRPGWPFVRRTKDHQIAA